MVRSRSSVQGEVVDMGYAAYERIRCAWLCSVAARANPSMHSKDRLFNVVVFAIPLAFIRPTR